MDCVGQNVPIFIEAGIVWLSWWSLGDFSDGDILILVGGLFFRPPTFLSETDESLWFFRAQLISR